MKKLLQEPLDFGAVRYYNISVAAEIGSAVPMTSEDPAVQSVSLQGVIP